MKPILSIIIVSYNTADITVDCLKSILQDKGLKEIPYEVIIIDNNSPDDSVEKIKKFIDSHQLNHWTLVANKSNPGFGGANNQAATVSQGNYLLFLNPDTIVLHSAISQSLDWLSSHPEAAACTAQLLNSDKTIQASGGYFPNPLNIFSWSTGIDDLPLVNGLIPPFHPHTPEFYTHDNFYLQDRPLDWLTGAYFLIRAHLFKKIGGFDQSYFMYGEEVDLFYRLRQECPQAQFWYLIGPQIIHLGGASSDNKNFPLVKEYQGLLAFFQKHKPKWQYQLVKIALKLSPTLRLRALYYLLTGNQKKASFYLDTCSKI